MTEDKKTKKIQTAVSQDAYKQLQAIAETERMLLSEFIRDAIRQRCKELGYEIDLSVDSWGGRRIGSGRK